MTAIGIHVELEPRKRNAAHQNQCPDAHDAAKRRDMSDESKILGNRRKGTYLAYQSLSLKSRGMFAITVTMDIRACCHSVVSKIYGCVL